MSEKTIQKKLSRDLAEALLSGRIPLEGSQSEFWTALQSLKTRLDKLIVLANKQRWENPLFEIVARSEADRLGYEGGKPYIEIDPLGEVWIKGLEQTKRLAELKEVLGNQDSGEPSIDPEDIVKAEKKSDASLKKDFKQHTEKVAAPVPSKPPEEVKPEPVEEKPEEAPKKRKQSVPKMAELREMASNLGVEIPDGMGSKRKDIHAYLLEIAESQPKENEEPMNDAEGEALIESLQDGDNVTLEENEAEELTDPPRGKGMMKTAPAVSPVSIFDPDDDDVPDFGKEEEETILEEPEPEEMPVSRGALHDIAEDSEDVDLDTLLKEDEQTPTPTIEAVEEIVEDEEPESQIFADESSLDAFLDED
jgi:hypothetical protein